MTADKLIFGDSIRSRIKDIVGIKEESRQQYSNPRNDALRNVFVSVAVHNSFIAFYFHGREIPTDIFKKAIRRFKFEVYSGNDADKFQLSYGGWVVNHDYLLYYNPELLIRKNGIWQYKVMKIFDNIFQEELSGLNIKVLPSLTVCSLGIQCSCEFLESSWKNGTG